MYYIKAAFMPLVPEYYLLTSDVMYKYYTTFLFFLISTACYFVMDKA